MFAIWIVKSVFEGKIILAIFIIGLIVTIYFVVKNFKDSFSKIKNSRIQMYKWDVSSKIMLFYQLK